MKKLKIVAKCAIFDTKIFFRASLLPPLAPLRGFDTENPPRPHPAESHRSICTLQHRLGAIQPQPASASPFFIAAPPIVGYQNKGFENSGYNIAGATFLPVGKTADDLTLKDISASEDFINSSIQFMTTGGANAKTTFNGKTVTAKYVYWPASAKPEDGEGWYLDADGDATVNQNAVKIPMGTGFLVSRNVSEANATLIYSGEVNASPVTLNFASSGYNVVGNCLPTDLTLGDITVSEDFVNSSIQFMTTGGANAKTTFNGKTVTAKYVYWPASAKPEDGTGWYLDADGDATINQNELVTIPAGGGFLVSRNVSEAAVTLTLPAAL